MWGKGVLKCRPFSICLNLNDYQFKTNRYRSTYMNPMVTTIQKPTIDKQKQEKNK